MIAASVLAPCAKARLMRRKLALDTDLPRLLEDKSASMMLSDLTTNGFVGATWGVLKFSMSAISSSFAMRGSSSSAAA